ncbi:hypothetical protein JCM8097_000206 [Rhodosporidiobolus ruineniae]
MSSLGDRRLPPLRYLALGTALFLLLVHFVALLSAPSYASTSQRTYENLRGKLGLGSDSMPVQLDRAGGGSELSRTGGGAAAEWARLEGDQVGTNTTLANAAFVFLSRNEDLWDVVPAMQSLLDRIPKARPYPWVFLNDKEYTDEFKRATSAVATGPCHYGVVPKEHWEEPSWIDEGRASEARKKMEEDKVIYGGSKTYRRMCRYQSGFFFRHPLVQQYDYYWRIDPGVKFYCDIDYDPFVYMRGNGKQYGFTVSLYEYEATIPTLWKTTKDFVDQNPQYLAKPNALDWISNDKGETYNRFHFWSNFEIGSLAFFRSEAYLKYFEHLDRSGGFSYERWGDAPVHSLAVALFLKPDEVHYFKDMGYFHNPFLTCPKDPAVLAKGRCSCDPNHQNNFYSHWYSGSEKWVELFGNT